MAAVLSDGKTTLDRVQETMIVLNSSSYGSAFDDFCTLLTDGENMWVVMNGQLRETEQYAQCVT
jgi:hypothetical protein